ncbi:MAG TPA: class I SAM-dependent methyltransferase [Pseudonocardiaceae bacterium]|jgi:ubiquinone/menaquinone biosynthesis C-methylase UbiE|nr:class I SAM-dependent methyltransferase [Pseudonocardiaceae bacterium]
MGDQDVRQFNQRAARYETDWLGRHFHLPVQRATLAIAARLAANPTAILDVGCGTGALLRLAAERFPGATRTGIDPAEQMIAVATQADPTALFQVAPAENLPFDDDRFDLVLSTNSFHNWSDQATGIAEIGRVLAPGGVLVLVDPFAVGWLRPWAALIGKRRRMRTRTEVEAMLDAAGLSDSSWAELAPVIHAVTSSR